MLNTQLFYGHSWPDGELMLTIFVDAMIAWQGKE